MNSVKIVKGFWERAWKACHPAAIDDFVIGDFVITTGGVDVVSRTKFKEWAAAFMAKINDLQFDVIETFQNEDWPRSLYTTRHTFNRVGAFGGEPT